MTFKMNGDEGSQVVTKFGRNILVILFVYERKQKERTSVYYLCLAGQKVFFLLSSYRQLRILHRKRS